MRAVRLVAAIVVAIIVVAVLASMMGQYVAVNELILRITGLMVGQASPTQLLLLVSINATNPTAFPTPPIQGTAALFMAGSQVGTGSLEPFSVGPYSSRLLEVPIRVDVLNATEALLKALASGNLRGLSLGLRGQVTALLLGIWAYTRPYSANFSRQ